MNVYNSLLSTNGGSKKFTSTKDDFHNLHNMKMVTSALFIKTWEMKI